MGALMVNDAFSSKAVITPLSLKIDKRSQHLAKSQMLKS
jgi:hypothetical protein